MTICSEYCECCGGADDGKVWAAGCCPGCGIGKIESFQPKILTLIHWSGTYYL